MGAIHSFHLFCEEKGREEARKALLGPKQKTFSVTYPHTRMVHQIPDDGSEMSELFRVGEQERVEAEAHKSDPEYLVYRSREWNEFYSDQTSRPANSHATF